MATPFAYLAIKDGALDGMLAPMAESSSQEEFFAEFLSSGYSIVPVANRAEFNAKIEECHGTLGNAPTPEPRP